MGQDYDDSDLDYSDDYDDLNSSPVGGYDDSGDYDSSLVDYDDFGIDSYDPLIPSPRRKKRTIPRWLWITSGLAVLVVAAVIAWRVLWPLKGEEKPTTTATIVAKASPTAPSPTVGVLPSPMPTSVQPSPVPTPTPIRHTATPGPDKTPSPQPPPRILPPMAGNLRATYDTQGQLLRVTDDTDHPVTDPALVARLPAALPRTHTGIPLSQVAQALADLTALEGAAYDQANGQLILFGQKDPAAPTLNPDDLVVALKSVYAGYDPWVSIDPGPTQGEMVVSYSEMITDTHFGQAMFEADRQLKVLGLGRDNLTSEPVTSTVPGYRNLVELNLALEKDTHEEESWHRFWIEVHKMRLALSQDRQAIAFRENSLEVNTEYLGPDFQPLPQPRSDPAAETFAAHLTQHYDQFADERPVFGEVTTLAKLVSLAKWTEYADIPMDITWLEGQSAIQVETSLTTPAITVTDQVQDGTWTHLVWLYGGVKLQFENEYGQPGSPDETLWAQGLAARPSQAALDWTFEVAGQPHHAVAISLAKAPRPGSYLGPIVNDLDLPGIPSLQFSRRYDSFSLEPGLLGPGWVTNISYLHFPLPKRIYSLDDSEVEIYPEVIWVDPITGRQPRYRLEGWYTDGRIVYRPPDPPDTSELLLEGDGTYTLARPAEPTLQFDAAGQLLIQQDGAKDVIRYTYIEGRPASIERFDGARIELRYDAQGRIVEAITSTGEARCYIYSDHGDLIGVADREGNTLASFEYDEWHRLILEMDGQGNVLRWNVYDTLERLVAWQDAQGRYEVTFGKEQADIVYASNEGPILSQGRPTDKFLQLPGVQAFRSAVGEGFLPDLAAYEKLQSNNVSLFYIARWGDRAHMLLNGQYVLADGVALIQLSALQEALSRAQVSLPTDRPVVVIGKGSWNLDLQELFPGRPVFYAEALNVDMISQNLRKVMKAGIPLPENTSIHLLIPRSREELTLIGFHPAKWRYWEGTAQKFEKLAKKWGFEIAPHGTPMKEQIERDLGEKENVIFVIAHSDGTQIYLPDGTQLAPAEWSGVLQGEPLVIVVGCTTSSVIEGPSLAKELVNKGAKAVIAPFENVSAAKAEALFGALLELSQKAGKDARFLDIWLSLIKSIKLRFFRIIIGKNKGSAPVYA